MPYGLVPYAFGPYASFLGLGASGPGVIAAAAVSTTTVLVTFSEAMEAGGTILLPGSYTIAEEPGSAARVVTGVASVAVDQVLLTLDGPLSPGLLNYLLTVDAAIENALGDPMDPLFLQAAFGGQGIPAVASWSVEGRRWLISPFYQQPAINALLEALLDQLQEVEQAAADLVQFRNLDSATGALLAQLGTKLGYLKPGPVLDDDYRIALRGKARANHTNGSVPEMIEILRMMLLPIEHRLEQSFPLCARFFADDPVSYDQGQMFADVLNYARGQTVNSAFVYDPAGLDIICFADDTSGRPIIGWGEEGGGGTFDGAVLTEEDAGD